MLVILGILIASSAIITLSIGHYHHDQFANETFSVALSPLQAKLQEFKAGGNGAQVNGQFIENSNHERAIFRSIIKRVKWTKKQCNSIPHDERNTLEKSFTTTTDLPLLPEGGVARTLKRWIKKNPTSNSNYPTCYLPPPKSCGVTSYTLIIMSHTTERLKTFMDPLGSMIDSWPGLNEIIIVWNGDSGAIAQAAYSKGVYGTKHDKQGEYAAKILQWHGDKSHPLRIFYSLEHGLDNNLLNRYHPKLKPKNEAVMYFDDDGPFWSREAMVYGGFELWKRNSNVQVGCFPRNVRFLSDRMKQLQKTNLQQNIDIMVKDMDGYSGESHPTFTPKCRNVAGDHVEYNYFSFPDFAGHVLLPSGTFLHRNFLCFIWHPAFEELRQWVVAHKTMPDDMTVSTLISHLSGRAPRTFPREVVSTSRRLTTEDLIEPILMQNKHDVNQTFLKSPPPDQSHRRLLWKQKNWGAWREEAINSILGYFGSIHPGTVGWCAGTPYMRENTRGVPFVCHPEKPSLNLLPWLTEGGVGSSQCPLDPTIVEKALTVAKRADPTLAFDDLCGDCKYKGLKITCRKRLQFLVDRYSTDLNEAKSAVIKEDPNCEKK